VSLFVNQEEEKRW